MFSESARTPTLADVTIDAVRARSRADLGPSTGWSPQRAGHDPLTGLPSRVLFLARLEDSLLRGQRCGKIVAVLFVDLDQCKTINDIHGYRVGNELLVAVARRLSESLRPSDTLARLSGDQFVIVCEDLEEASHAERIASRLGFVLVLPFVLSGAEVAISASVSIATAGSPSDPARGAIPRGVG